MEATATQGTLRLIGYWAGPMAPHWPDPRDFVDRSWDADARDLVVDYLAAGFVIRGFGGVSECRFCRQKNGALERSDGIWYWPDGLAHYLTEHGVRLPQQFVDHVYARLDDMSDANATWIGGGRDVDRSDSEGLSSGADTATWRSPAQTPTARRSVELIEILQGEG